MPCPVARQRRTKHGFYPTEALAVTRRGSRPLSPPVGRRRGDWTGGCRVLPKLWYVVPFPAPTRRHRAPEPCGPSRARAAAVLSEHEPRQPVYHFCPFRDRQDQPGQRTGASPARRSGLHLPRSEEHTSELQSRGHLVCRLLLEKKNNTPKRKCSCSISLSYKSCNRSIG